MKNCHFYFLLSPCILGGYLFLIPSTFACDIFFGNGTKDWTKDQGIITRCIDHNVLVFEGHTIQDCPGNPSQGEVDLTEGQVLAPKPDKTDICYTCREPKRSENRTEIGGYDVKGMPIFITVTHNFISRICDEKVKDHLSILDGALFVPGSPGYAKNAECGMGTTKPDPGLIVVKSDAQSRMWDAVPPVCQRMPGVTGLQNGRYYSDEDVLAATNNPTDSTLTYADGLHEPYSGIWTNRDINGQWQCVDGDSGCKIPFIVPNRVLWHYQSVHIPTADELTDKTKNVADPLACDSRVTKPKSIRRSCLYTLSVEYISAGELKTLMDGGKTSTTTGKNDYNYVNDLIHLSNFPTGQAFKTTLRELEKISKANFAGDMTRLYSRDDSKCIYIATYEDAHPPLIDKILPTVTFEVSGKTVLNNERNENIPQSYLAGPQTFMIRFEDAHESNYSRNPRSRWEHWNGISGLNTVHFTLKRIKTHDNRTVNEEIFDSYVDTSFTHEGNHDGWLPYNQTGTIHDIAHYAIFDGTLTDTSGIEKTGLYELTYSISDYAGNLNEGTAQFQIYPSQIDPSKTIFRKINKLDRKIIYEMSGNPTQVSNPNQDSSGYYANAIDFHEYEVSLFDKYRNPAYERTVTDIKLNDPTKPYQIYLDDLNKNSESAIVVSNKKTTLEDGARTGLQGTFSMYTTSYKGGKFSEKYAFTTCTWGDDYIEVGCTHGNTVPNTPAKAETGTFLHIFTGALDLYTGNRIDLGTKNDIRMNRYTTTTTIPNMSSFSLERFMETLRADSPGFKITSTGSYTGTRPSPYYESDKFAKSTFIPEQISSYGIVNIIKIYSAPLLHFNMSGIDGTKNVRHYLVNSEDYFGSGMIFGIGQLNRIFIQGNKSVKGKEGYVNPDKSIAKMNSADVSNLIRKNVGVLTRNRNPGSSADAADSIVNRVKYIKGMDVYLDQLNDDEKWDTLILVDGNLYIEDNYNKAKKRKGIIVLSNGNNTKGHIFIQPDVQFIGATLYGEEAMKSVDGENNELTTSNSERALLLSNQLVFFGGVYTKNTVGGAVRAGTEQDYLVPWNNNDNNKTTSLDEAVRYDLAFLRMNNLGYNTLPLYNEGEPQKSLNIGRNEFVVILFDERNITDPLPGFTTDIK